MNELDLASILIFQREQRGLSLRAAAKSIGISNPYLSQLETGKVLNPTLDVIQKLTRAYRIKPDVWMRVKTTSFPEDAPCTPAKPANASLPSTPTPSRTAAATRPTTTRQP